MDVLRWIIDNEESDSYVKESAISALSRCEMSSGFKREEA
jgi:bilin biosynthesis protein